MNELTENWPNLSQRLEKLSTHFDLIGNIALVRPPLTGLQYWEYFQLSSSVNFLFRLCDYISSSRQNLLVSEKERRFIFNEFAGLCDKAQFVALYEAGQGPQGMTAQDAQRFFEEITNSAEDYETNFPSKALDEALELSRQTCKSIPRQPKSGCAILLISAAIVLYFMPYILFYPR